jgi:hypothetical protein
MTRLPLIRDPLLHFILLGALLFVVDRVRAAPEKKPPTTTAATPTNRTIVVTSDIRRGLIDESTRAYGRAPNEKETESLVAQWVDEEVLYREGLERSFDKDDARIRHLIAQKMSFVLEQQVVLPKPTDADLDDWFHKHASKWQKPDLIDFTQVFVNGLDTAADDRSRALLKDLVEKGAEPNQMGDMFSGGRRYRRRSIADLTEAFGPDFTQGLGDQPENVWKQHRSRFGFHLVRIDKRTAASSPPLADVRQEVEDDFTRAKRSDEVKKSVASLRSKFSIQ